MTSEKERLHLIVHLWIYSNQEEEFERFEERAAEMMQEFGGRIDRRVRHGDETDAEVTPTMLQSFAPDDLPFETHLVSFPDRASFEAYRTSPSAASVAELRSRIIRRTEIDFS